MNSQKFFQKAIKIYTHKVALSDDTPTKFRSYSVPYNQLKIQKDHLDEMLPMGVIRKSNSPWASSVVMVEKSDGFVFSTNPSIPRFQQPIYLKYRCIRSMTLGSIKSYSKCGIRVSLLRQ